MPYLHTTRPGWFIATYADGSDQEFHIEHIETDIVFHLAYVMALAQQRAGDLPAGRIVSVRPQ